MTGDGPSVLLTSEHVISVLIKRNSGKHIAYVRQHEHAEVGWALRALYRFFYPNLTNKSCRLSLQAKKASSIKLRCLLERGIRLYPRVSWMYGKVKATNGIIGICKAGLETLRSL